MDLPDPERPVSQAVAPRDGRSPRATSVACQVTLSDTGDPALGLGRAEDHAGAHRVVGGLVHEDEAAGVPVATVLVAEERLRGAPRAPTHLVQRPRRTIGVPVKRFDGEPVLQVLEPTRTP